MKFSDPNNNPDYFDLIIIGGAMTGATLALTVSQLSRNKLSIALIEAQSIQYQHQGFDTRSIALSYSSCALLNKLDLWQPLAYLATPIKRIHVSDQGHAGITEFNAKEEQLPFLGQVIELTDAGLLLYERLAKAANITLFCPAKMQSIKQKPHSNIVTLGDGTQLSTKLVVAADGGQSRSAELLGISLVDHDFNQVAIVSNVSTCQFHNFRAFERFTPQGPVALLPLSRNRNSLIWCCRPEEAIKIMELDKEEFLAKLQHTFGWRLGKLKQCSIPHCYPIILRQTSKLISHRFAVVGNAAQTLHPIAGQGFNLALRDVITLATKITFAFENNHDWGDMTTLQHYRAARELDRDKTIRIISSLVYGFSNTSLPFIAARNFGLIAMSFCKTLKTPLVHHMMGIKQNTTIKVE